MGTLDDHRSPSLITIHAQAFSSWSFVAKSDSVTTFHCQPRVILHSVGNVTEAKLDEVLKRAREFFIE
jgi:hypothetical protein